VIDVRLARFAAVGAANTLLGLSMIYACKGLLGLTDAVSNMLGYGFAVMLGFTLNKRWTFQHAGAALPALGRYLLVLALAYVANLVTVLYAIEVVHLNGYRAQALGIVPYAAAGYIGSRLFAFRKTASSTINTPPTTSPDQRPCNDRKA
jgi:putative flippase GtrA